MNGSVSSGMGFFWAIYLVAIASWVTALIFYRRARKHYLGPTGWAQLRNPFARYISTNYTADGASLLRWQFIFMGIFAISCLVALVFARIKTLGHV
jgi:multidrug efflux pump subunit AcrB